MKGKWITYTNAELAWIEKHKTMTRADLHKAFCRKFARDDVSKDHIKALCSRRGWKTGRDGRYPPGSVPANKGQKMPYNANSARTRFKKGHVPPNRRHIGHERLTKDGFVEISIAETNPYTGHARRYVHKHRWLWEQRHGALADGMVLKCLDGNKENTDPSNWEPVSRGVLLRLNDRWSARYDDVEPEVKPAVLTAAKLHDRARQLRKRKPGRA